MNLLIKVEGLDESIVSQIYELSLQGFNAGEISEFVHYSMEDVKRAIEAIDKCVVKFHKKNPTYRSGDPANWQANLDQLKIIKREIWLTYRECDVGQKIKVFEQLRRINRDIAELEGLLAPVKVESSVSLTIAEESRKQLKEMFK